MNLHFDEMISSPARLAILAALVPGPPVRFKEMKDATGLSLDYCSKIKRGLKTPHERHWPELREFG